MNVKLIAIAALGKNREIGHKDKLPWNLPDEYEHFKRSIKDHFVLIGRKNFELHQRKVEGARPIVLTRDTSYRSEGAEVFQDLTQVMEFLESRKEDSAFVIGGAEIYKLTLPYLSEFLWTEVEYSGDADKFFPDFSMYDWKQTHEEKHPGWSLRKLIKTPQDL